MNPGKFKQRYRQTRVFREGIFTRSAAQSVLTGMSASDFKKFYTLKAPKCSFHYGKVECLHNSIHIAGKLGNFPVPTQFDNLKFCLLGRYNKYSRALCQTPWFIEGEKHKDTSIQELICEHLEPYFRSRGTYILFNTDFRKI